LRNSLLRNILHGLLYVINAFELRKDPSRVSFACKLDRSTNCVTLTEPNVMCDLVYTLPRSTLPKDVATFQRPRTLQANCDIHKSHAVVAATYEQEPFCCHFSSLKKQASNP